jgi:hypothetical protein
MFKFFVNQIIMPVVLTKPLNGVSRSAADNRSRLEADVRRHDQVARAAAERGDLETAGRCILMLLECERRRDSQGPQVLQLIKPRPVSRGLVS